MNKLQASEARIAERLLAGGVSRTVRFPDAAARLQADKRDRECEPALSPALQPDFNPIENAFAKLKALLRKTAARTVDALWYAIGRFVDTFTPAECANYFAAAGHDAT